MADQNTGKSFSFVRLYFTIVSVVSVIGMVVAYAVGTYNVLRTVIVSDDERMAQRGRYEVDACKTMPADVDPYAKPITEPGAVATPKTPQEIAECEAKVTQRMIDQRSFEMKDTAVGGAVWGTFFLILFLTHFPRMMKLERQSKVVVVETTKPRAPAKKIAKK